MHIMNPTFVNTVLQLYNINFLQKAEAKEEDFDDDIYDDFNFGDLNVSDSAARRMQQNGEPVRSKPNKMFAMIKSEMDEKAKKKSKQAYRVQYKTFLLIGNSGFHLRPKKLPTQTSKEILPSALEKEM